MVPTGATVLHEDVVTALGDLHVLLDGLELHRRLPQHAVLGEGEEVVARRRVRHAGPDEHALGAVLHLHGPADGVAAHVGVLVVEGDAAGAENREGDPLVVDGKGIQSNEDGRYPSGSGTTDTIEALQAYLDTTVDGYFSAPSSAVKALQKRLNTGKF